MGGVDALTLRAGVERITLTTAAGMAWTRAIVTEDGFSVESSKVFWERVAASIFGVKFGPGDMMVLNPDATRTMPGIRVTPVGGGADAPLALRAVLPVDDASDLTSHPWEGLAPPVVDFPARAAHGGWTASAGLIVEGDAATGGVIVVY